MRRSQFSGRDRRPYSTLRYYPKNLRYFEFHLTFYNKYSIEQSSPNHRTGRCIDRRAGNIFVPTVDNMMHTRYIA